MKWFDLHCDTLTACEEQGLSMRSNTRTQLDFLRLREAGASAQCFAVFLDREACEQRGVSPWRRYEQLRDFFFTALKKNEDVVRPVRTAGELADAERDGAVGAILTVEGGELLGCGADDENGELPEGGAGDENGELPGGGTSAQNSECPDVLHARLLRMWEDGVRLLTLTWNYENCLGYPNGSGGGLKKAGYEAVACMQELGMVVDVSHLSDRGFWDVMAAAKKPVTASHSCARSLCGHQRNLTDEQLRAIGKNGGIVGLNFHAPFLKENGVSGSVEEAAYHLRHIISCAGSEAAALGSDYDGMQGAPEWGGCEGMPRLIEALFSYFDADTMEKICYRNAARLLQI
ncbi:MAG: dipeptidase [Lachnospiraceae bacterium]|nr:dipeptidase [Lachnospiraceae bacterium]